jgi:exonuclease SbcC
MKVKKIVLKNIRSYREEEISFPEGSILLSGDIGSGKTTVLLALEYALFGLQPGQKGSSLLRSDSSSGEVTLYLDIDGKEISLERKLKRSPKGVTNESSSITIDGQRIESSTTEIKNKILELLGYPQEFIKRTNLLYRYTVYTPQEQMKQIISEDFELRLNIIRYIFGIDKYRRIRENLDISLIKLKDECKLLQLETKQLETEKSNFQSIGLEISIIHSKIQEFESHLLTKKSQREKVEKELEELENKAKEREKFLSEVEKTKIMLASKREAILSLTKEINEIEHSISEAGTSFDMEKYDSVSQDIKNKKEYLDKLNGQYISIISTVNSTLLKKDELENRKERIFQLLVCPTCLQDVPDFHKHNILNSTENNLSDMKKKLDLIETEKTLLADLISKETNDKERLEQEKLSLELHKSRQVYTDGLKKRLIDLNKRKFDFEKDVTLLSSHLDSLKEEILNFSKFESLCRLKKDELRQSLLAERNGEISLAELKKELEMTNKEYIRLKASIALKEISKDKLTNLNELIDWLSTGFIKLIEYIERSVLIKLRDEFSSLFSKWFQMLVSEASFDVKLDENFTPVVMQGEFEMDYSFLSGGERTAVALAYRLALNQTINLVMGRIKTKDIVILDEPTDGFSESQLERMREVLDELDVAQLIIVSHEQKIEGFVDNVIKLRKISGVSSTECDSAKDELIYQKT